MQGDRERLLAAGFDGYVSKPVDVVELLDTVRRHCDTAARGGRTTRGLRPQGVRHERRRASHHAYETLDVNEPGEALRRPGFANDRRVQSRLAPH